MGDEWEQLLFGAEEEEGEDAPAPEAEKSGADDAKVAVSQAESAGAGLKAREVVISDAEEEDDGVEAANQAGADYFAALEDLPCGTPDQLKPPISSSAADEGPLAPPPERVRLQPQQKASAKAKLQPASNAPAKSSLPPLARGKAPLNASGQAKAVAARNERAGGKSMPVVGGPGRPPAPVNRSPAGKAPPNAPPGSSHAKGVQPARGSPQGKAGGVPQRPRVIRQANAGAAPSVNGSSSGAGAAKPVIRQANTGTAPSSNGGSASGGGGTKPVKVIRYGGPKEAAHPKAAAAKVAAKAPGTKADKVLRSLQKVRSEHMQGKFVAAAMRRGKAAEPGQARSPAAPPRGPAWQSNPLKRQISWEQKAQPDQPERKMRAPPWMAQQQAPKSEDDGAQGRGDERRIVVNIANVGCSYAKRVLGMDDGKFHFDWHGIRICVNTLVKAGFAVIGVVHENYTAPDKQRGRVTIPPDIKAKFESLCEAPRIRSENHRSADDEVTIKCAFRRNCCFLDNDNYSEWTEQLHEEDVRNWLKKSWERLHKFYFWDTGTGDFNLLHGNNLQPGQDKKDLAKPRQR